MDTYFEFLVKRKKNSKDFAIIALTVFSIFIAWYLLTYLYLTPLGMFALPLQIGYAYLAYKFLGRRNVEFEYCVTGGDVDVDKIMNRQKRVRVASVGSKSIISMAPEGSSNLEPIGTREIIDATSHNPDAKVYCLIFGEGRGKVLKFEPTEKMVEELQKRNPRKVFVD